MINPQMTQITVELVRQRLCESADHYMEIYADDSETQEWTDAELTEWPD